MLQDKEQLVKCEACEETTQPTTINCKICGKKIGYHNRVHKFCSSTCRSVAHRHRNWLKKLESKGIKDLFSNASLNAQQ